MKSPRFLYWFNDEDHFRRFLWGLALLAVFFGIGAFLVPQAGAASFYCDGPTAEGNLFSYDTLTDVISNGSGGESLLIPGSGALYNQNPFGSTACSNSLGIFGRVICFFKMTIGQIISMMYCSFQYQLRGPISLCLTLFITVYGIMVVTGMTGLRKRDAVITLLKLGLVWAFATNAQWGIGIAYSFFMGLADQLTSLVWNAATGGSGSGGPGSFLTAPDKFINSFLSYITTGSGASDNPISLPSTLTPFCASMLFLMFILLFLALPTLGGSIIAVAIQYIWLYVRTLLGYLTALVLIGFLFVMAPLFFCFVLFKTTRHLFEKWLQYVTSFSLQIVITFAFLALLGLIPFGDFFMELLSLIRQYDVTWSADGKFTMPTTLCSVCQYIVSPDLSLLGTGSGRYPIQCDIMNPAVIPLSELPLAGIELLQAVVVQALALYVIGSIMMDFIKQAPQFAVQLTGRLPMASILGGGGGGGGIGGVGVISDPLEGYVNDLQNKLKDPNSYQGWKRAIPAGILAAAGLPLLAGMRKGVGQGQGVDATLTQAPGHPSGSSSDSSYGQPVATSSGDTPLDVLTAKAASSGGKGAQSDQDSSQYDAMLLANQSMKQGDAPAQEDQSLSMARADLDTYKYAMRSELAQSQYQATKVAESESYEQAMRDLHIVRKFKTQQAAGEWVDPQELAQALGRLQHASNEYFMAWEVSGGSYQRLINATIAAKEAAGGTAADAQPTIGEMSNLVRDTLRKVELQVNVQRYLNPEKQIEGADKVIAQASNDFENAQTMDGLAQILEQLGHLERTLG